MSLKEASKEITGQLMMILNQLTEEQYILKISVLSSSSLGKHVRHVIECYQCFLDGYHTGFVNYDLRKRDIEIEISIKRAVSALQEIQNSINHIDLNRKLILNAELGSDSEEEMVTLNSTSGRELIYNIEHAIHHMAIIKIGCMVICSGINLPQNFGIAYSTVKDQKKVCAQ